LVSLHSGKDAELLVVICHAQAIADLRVQRQWPVMGVKLDRPQRGHVNNRVTSDRKGHLRRDDQRPYLVASLRAQREPDPGAEKGDDDEGRRLNEVSPGELSAQRREQPLPHC
jgi:hypothetical protein